jgi:hypothetical protein
MSVEQLLEEFGDEYMREQFEADRVRLRARICTKRGIDDVDALIREHRYVHSAEDLEDEYIHVIAMGRAAGWL